MIKDNGTKEMIANHELWYIKLNVWCSVVPILIIEERERGCDFPCQPLCHEICGTYYCGCAYNWRIFKISKAYVCMCVVNWHRLETKFLLSIQMTLYIHTLFLEEHSRIMGDWWGNIW